MLAEVKMALRITTTAYDPEIARLILAAVSDLGIVDVEAAGVSLTISTSQQGVVTVTDSSTITDQLLIRAIITYVRLNFGTPDDYDRLYQSYWEQKAQLITASGYGLPGVTV